MNQILITGDERVTESIKRPKKVLPINGIVIFYAISIIILGICMISGSVYAKEKINEKVEANIKPEISVERDDENNTIEIKVTHIRGIKNVTYRWNDENEIIIDGKNSKNISKTIDLIGGENTLKISVTEENGNIKTFEKTFIAGNVPEIELEAVANGVKIIASCEEKIDYVQYSWDNGQTEKIEIGKKQYEGIINAPTGRHILKIEVVTVNGMKASKEQAVVGDTEPTVNVQSKLVNGKITFVIDAEDDEGITTVTIIHNGGEKQVINVNAKTYHNEVIMTEGEINTIIVTATNVNGLPKTRRIKFENI